MKIQSVQNERVKQWTKLHSKKGREAMQQFLIEGEHLIQEALKDESVELILVEEGNRNPFDGVDCIECSASVMKKLSQNISGCKLMAVCLMKKKTIKKRNRLILLDNIQDPGNMGTMIRTAHAFGFDGVYCSKDCVDLYNEKTIRSTQGALFLIPVIRRDLNFLVEELKKEEVCVIGTALNHATPLSSCDKLLKMAFIFGNEGQGVSKELLEKTDKNIKIEMQGFDSLNVAVAAGICMHSFRKVEIET